MKMLLGIKLILLVFIWSLAGCAKTETDFCKYLSLEEVQVFDQSITSSEMRQTEKILYCVYRNDAADRLFISLDRALKYPPEDFLKVVAKNSPEEYEEIMTFSGADINTAALFLSDERNQLKLEFLISQNSEYSVTIRAHDLVSTNTDKITELKDIAKMVVSRI